MEIVILYCKDCDTIMNSVDHMMHPDGHIIRRIKVSFEVDHSGLVANK